MSNVWGFEAEGLKVQELWGFGICGWSTPAAAVPELFIMCIHVLIYIYILYLDEYVLVAFQSLDFCLLLGASPLQPLHFSFGV